MVGSTENFAHYMNHDLVKNTPQRSFVTASCPVQQAKKQYNKGSTSKIELDLFERWLTRDDAPQGLQHGVADGRVVGVADAVVHLDEERVGARVDGHQPGEGQPGLHAHRPAAIVQSLQEGRLQLRQELLQHHAHLRQRRSFN